MADAVTARPGFTLASLDLDRRFPDKKSYERALDQAQTRMLEVEMAYKSAGLRGIVMFEGWDAGGKGGAIQRLTGKLDTRWLRVWAIGAPTPEEQGRH